MPAVQHRELVKSVQQRRLAAAHSFASLARPLLVPARKPDFRPSLKRYAAWERVSAMGLLTFALNVTLDGCCDHREMVANDEMLRYWTRVMDAAGAMLFGRRTYELMEDAWPQVARDPKATPSNRDWAKKLPSLNTWSRRRAATSRGATRITSKGT